MGAAALVAERLPAPVRQRLRATRKSVRLGWRRLILSAVVRSRAFAALYYALIHHELLREARAVAAGQLRYAEEQTGDAASYYLLRRNIHRLEKGLIMRPRRPVFAADFIRDTVDVYARAAAAAGPNPPAELGWAHDVLTAYFAVVDTSARKIGPAFHRFQSVPPVQGCGEGGAVPYRRPLDVAPPVAFDDFMALTRRRRSVRWYQDRPVDRALVDKAVAAAAQAPSACNRQPFHFRVFDDPARARAIAGIAMGTKGFADKLTGLIVIVGQLRAYPFERDRHAIYIDASLAAMSLMFAFETMGVATCSINWPDHEPYESRMKAAIGLAPDERVVMLLAYGWPDPEGMVPYSSKREIDEVRRFG